MTVPASDLPGAPFLAYANHTLTLDGVALEPLAATHGTPLFVYSAQAMRSALAAYQTAFVGRKAKICYAMKANSSLGVLQVFQAAGCGFDIVSGGELERALAVDALPENIVFSGVGKTKAEMKRALEVGVGCFNVESESELDLLSAVATEMGKIARVSMRVNPNVDAKTHPYISTGLKANKFGVAHEHAVAIYERAAKLPGIEVVGVDCHIGSQITQIGPYLDAMDRMLDLVDAIEAAGVPLKHIDFGGGLGINYNGDTPPSATDLWQQLLAKVDARGHGGKGIMIEPGRSLVGNAGVCVTEVLHIKRGEEKNFCIVDAAMNDLPRPAMYQAFQRIVPLLANAPDRQAMVADVVGPVCESGDWIGRDRELAVHSGDLLAVLSAGAYCMAMASNYNTRNRAAEILIDSGRCMLIRPRETVADQLRAELAATGSSLK
jgi:diaminopimelate decarboxylase